MPIKLKIVGGKNAGQELLVSGAKYVIGRAEGCQLRPRSDVVAERHCELAVEPGQVRLVDLGSPAGTLVNGQRVEGSRVLKTGDMVKIGPLELELIIQVSLSGTKKPKVQSVEEAAARMAGGAKSKADDVDSWLSGDDQPAAPSRYAARLSDADIAALGTASAEAAKHGKGGKPAADVPGSDETRDAAQDVLNKYYKRR